MMCGITGWIDYHHHISNEKKAIGQLSLVWPANGQLAAAGLLYLSRSMDAPL